MYIQVVSVHKRNIKHTQALNWMIQIKQTFCLKGVNFKENCGTASVGCYKIVWVKKLS